MSHEHSQIDDNQLGPEVIELEESQLTDAFLTRAQELELWRADRNRMEMLKKYRPKEYEEIMKEREAKGIKPPPELDQQ